MWRRRRGLRAATAIAAELVLMLLFVSIGASASRSDCCGDLETAITELETTSAAKRGRNMSLQVYGQVNRAIVFWNDTFDKKASFLDNSTSSSRLGLIGQGAVRAGLVAGYRLEIEFDADPSQDASNAPQLLHMDGPLAHGLRPRHAYVYLSDERLGRVSLGYQSPATDDITIINLGSQMNDAAVHYNNNFRLRLALGGGIISDLAWGQVAHNVDALRGDFIRYDTPSLFGFVLSAAFGDNDAWDVALRYQVAGQGLRFAAGVGYMDDSGMHYTDLKGSASLLHEASGLYVSVAGALRDDDVSVLSAHGQAYFHYVQAGVSKRWLPFGDTTVYADFGIYRNFNVGELLRVDPNSGQLVIWGTLADTEVMRTGFGIEQAFDSAGLLLYVQAHRYTPTIVGFPCDPDPSKFANQCGGDPNNLVTLPMQPWSAIVVGARVRF